MSYEMWSYLEFDSDKDENFMLLSGSSDMQKKNKVVAAEADAAATTLCALTVASLIKAQDCKMG